ncbi:hypothetical protein [Burkholderia cenocepacia]|uniref:hypothetical protein n=1 Tax=Burkholderia cenocepacia TaxID=95486 RepID=UPI000F59BFE9|nr:hypothetical protein [Burkholderia cenocepacia]MBR8247785.1 hypothetical protein [Burkholderia cenocepacia]MBR8285596.1 hypothetical protein [Burkholderia cenocepacia]MBR8499224.1 hypothetical protein [Burkholderia cenocepacia]
MTRGSFSSRGPHTPLAARARLLCLGALVPAAVLGAPSPDAAIRFRSTITVDRPTVMLADVADLIALPESVAQRAATVPVMSLARSATTVRVDARRLAASARRAMPMLGSWLANVPAANVDITLRRINAAGNTMSSACVTVLADLPVDTSPSADQIQLAACPGDGAVRAPRYDAESHVVRAARTMTAGEIVPAPATSRLATVHRGGRVFDTIQVGAVTVTRSGTALADAGPRHAAPVLTGDADVQLWRAPSDGRGH